MWSFHWSGRWKRKIPVAGGDRDCYLFALFLFGRPVEPYLIVGALHQFYLFRYAPRQRLLVQRNVGIILDGDFEGLLDQKVPLGGIGLLQHLAGQGVELLVAVAADIVVAAALRRIVAAAHDVFHDIVGIHRG